MYTTNTRVRSSSFVRFVRQQRDHAAAARRVVRVACVFISGKGDRSVCCVRQAARETRSNAGSDGRGQFAVKRKEILFSVRVIERNYKT